MFNTRQNFHHSKLPKLGEIVRLPGGRDGKGFKGIVEAFPLCDNVRPYSIGIHTCFVRSLRNGNRVKISGFLVKDTVD